MPDTPAQKRAKRRAPLPGFPIVPYKMSLKEIREYFDNPKLQCLICGRLRGNLGNHLQIHEATIDEYKEAFGFPWSRGLAGTEAVKNYSEATKERIEAGYDPSASGKRLDDMHEASKNQRVSSYKLQLSTEQIKRYNELQKASPTR